MSTMALDNIASYMFTSLSMADRQYLASKMVAEHDEYGLTSDERVLLEKYLTSCAEQAVKRVDAGEYFTEEEAERFFNKRIQQMRAAV